MARPKGSNIVQEIIETKPVKETKKKYSVNVIFDGELEEQIRDRAKAKGIGVATYIKLLVSEDLNNTK